VHRQPAVDVAFIGGEGGEPAKNAGAEERADEVWPCHTTVIRISRTPIKASRLIIKVLMERNLLG
jgi:hypothetical protein